MYFKCGCWKSTLKTNRRNVLKQKITMSFNLGIEDVHTHDQFFSTDSSEVMARIPYHEFPHRPFESTKKTFYDIQQFNRRIGLPTLQFIFIFQEGQNFQGFIQFANNPSPGIVDNKCSPHKKKSNLLNPIGGIITVQ